MNKYVVHFDEGVKGKLPVPGGGGDFCILIDQQMSGAQHFSLLVNSFQPGYVGPMHQHDVEHAWYILSGQGTDYHRGREVGDRPGHGHLCAHWRAPPGRLHRHRADALRGGVCAGRP